ncbi:MAG: glutamate racemase [Patescibacteria group bacterium]
MLGLFDSGLGGLTVAKAIIEKYPQTDLLYLGDTARAPYGNKGKELIQQYAIENARWLIDHGATAIGIACNTASVAATETLRTEFPQTPIYNVIEPVIAEIKRLKPRSVGVLGTRGTLASSVYQDAIRESVANVRIEAIACPLFVPLVEEGMMNSPEAMSIARMYLAPLMENPPEVLVLGCTHYPFLEKTIANLLPSTKILNGPALFAASLPPQPLGSSQQTFSFTDLPVHTKELAQTWLGCDGSKIVKTS